MSLHAKPKVWKRLCDEYNSMPNVCPRDVKQLRVISVSSSLRLVADVLWEQAQAHRLRNYPEPIADCGLRNVDEVASQNHAIPKLDAQTIPSKQPLTHTHARKKKKKKKLTPPGIEPPTSAHGRDAREHCATAQMVLRCEIAWVIDGGPSFRVIRRCLLAGLQNSWLVN